MFDLRINQVVGFYKQNVTLPQVFLKYFASKNQLPGFYISQTLVENGLIILTSKSKEQDREKWTGAIEFMVKISKNKKYKVLIKN